MLVIQVAYLFGLQSLEVTKPALNTYFLKFLVEVIVPLVLNLPNQSAKNCAIQAKMIESVIDTIPPLQQKAFAVSIWNMSTSVQVNNDKNKRGVVNEINKLFK